MLLIITCLLLQFNPMAYPDLLSEALAQITEPEQNEDVTYPALQASISPDKIIENHKNNIVPLNENKLAARIVNELKFYLSDSSNYRSTLRQVEGNNSNCKFPRVQIQSTTTMDLNTTTTGDVCITENKLLQSESYLTETDQQLTNNYESTKLNATQEVENQSADQQFTHSEEYYQW